MLAFKCLQWCYGKKMKLVSGWQIDGSIFKLLYLFSIPKRKERKETFTSLSQLEWISQLVICLKLFLSDCFEVFLILLLFIVPVLTSLTTTNNKTKQRENVMYVSAWHPKEVGMVINLSHMRKEKVLRHQSHIPNKQSRRSLNIHRPVPKADAISGAVTMFPRQSYVEP